MIRFFFSLESFSPRSVLMSSLPFDYHKARSRRRSNLRPYDYCYSLLPLVGDFVKLTDFAKFFGSWFVSHSASHLSRHLVYTRIMVFLCHICFY